MEIYNLEPKGFLYNFEYITREKFHKFNYDVC
jgi:hypothetical protein